MDEVDPKPAFKIGPMNGREARESGLWLEALVTPRRLKEENVTIAAIAPRPRGQGEADHDEPGATVGALLWPAAAIHLVIAVLLVRAWMAGRRAAG